MLYQNMRTHHDDLCKKSNVGDIMKKNSNDNKKVINRIISLLSAFIFILTILPLEFVPQETEKIIEPVLDVHAEIDSNELAALIAWYNGSDDIK